MVSWSLVGELAYDLTLLASCCLAFSRGGISARIVAATVIAGSGLTALAGGLAIFFAVRMRYGFLAIDILMLLIFDAVMVRSRSRWLIWVTGFQLAAVAIEVAAVLDPSSARLFMYIQGKFAYLILAAIDVGAIAHWRATRAVKRMAFVQ